MTFTNHNIRLNRLPFIPIPSDWSIERLADLGHFTKGKGILKDDIIDEGLPCIRYGEIYTKYDFVTQSFDSSISREVASESTEIKCGDILFAGSGETVDEIGKAVAYTGSQPAYAGGDVIIFTPNDRVDPIFISYTLETDFAKRQKRVMGQGNSVVHIYPRDLSKLIILLPPIEQQRQIVQVLKAANQEIELLKVKTEKLLEQKKGLMQVLLTGRKRLNP